MRPEEKFIVAMCVAYIIAISLGDGLEVLDALKDGDAKAIVKSSMHAIRDLSIIFMITASLVWKQNLIMEEDQKIDFPVNAAHVRAFNGGWMRLPRPQLEQKPQEMKRDVARFSIV